MAIRTDYTAGEQRTAAQVNEENQAILESQEKEGYSLWNSWNYLNIGSTTSLNIDDPQLNISTSGTSNYWFTVVDYRNNKEYKFYLSGSSSLVGVVQKGDYIYIWYYSSGYKLKRWNRTTFSSVSDLETITTVNMNANPRGFDIDDDGVTFYQNCYPSDGLIYRGTLSGTTLTRTDTFTLPSATGHADKFSMTENFYWTKDTSSPYEIQKFNRSDNSLVETITPLYASNVMLRIGGGLFVGWSTGEARIRKLANTM